MVSSVPTPTADSLNNAHTQSAGNMSQVNEQTARIIAHSKHFNALINQIPAKYYLLSSQDDGSKSGGWVKYGVNINKRKAPKDEVKENTKRAKKLRLDPASHKSTVDTQVSDLFDCTMFVYI
ncbi:hypothetical protein SARC_07447 [Sphaeroforma arctica JP610]|uniref:Ribosomal RNA-processing protein 14 N-terminal domain-containing protein n=1 Tax=Sphaeroforma arctica JP610 TaxID=667725 RepID=A0A0L0FUG6_9EUKA|nr:hypothetical protein SARC_07447 [Sphaeroforma arctica JP610]KNC80186.1 hypothetical protein SARC_07447 [Sphaeroforma arctica JP610]|eukprot:XP_014154088.1 hypothetical protein SARC_07447 [Sphaeroforma arctica JP610]